jgi:putative ABC transport system ATP-binding protein
MTVDYITVSQVTRSYARAHGNVKALAEVSFSIPQGQLVGLVGHSGAGKSTLLNIMGGLDRPTSGRVVIGGTDLGLLDSEKLALYRRETVGFVFQASRLTPALTVFENVMLPLVPVALAEEQKTVRVEKALDEANIAHRASHLPGELSGGEQQRAAVARAIVNDPQLILADEPTGELDADNSSRIMEILLRLHNEGRTVIVASHDPGTIDVTERVIRLSDGTLMGVASE